LRTASRGERGTEIFRDSALAERSRYESDSSENDHIIIVIIMHENYYRGI